MPATASRLLASDFAQLATTTVSSQLHIVLHYDGLFQPQRHRRHQPQELIRKAEEMVRQSARVLELMLVAACAHEVLAEIGADSFEASGKTPSFFTSRVKALTGLDAVAVIKEAEEGSLLKDRPLRTPLPSLSEVVRAARTVIESCPIAEIERLASHVGLEKWGHRCRVAYSALRAFVRRRDPREHERLGIVGREYARGALSVNEVAALLRMHPVDAVALLESHGHFRPIETIRLTDEERRLRYDRIRRDRLARAGKFQPTAEQIARDVIASERIEGVDARLWIRPDVR